MKQPQPSVDVAPHEQQLGKYRLIAKLGQGGMGTVYLALASGLGSFRKLLVVKELRHDLPWRESSLSMFMDEAQLAARLDHPNVLQTFEAGEANGRYFLAMEYLDGQPLSSLIDHTIPLELHVHILCEVLQGLQYAHELADYDGSSLHVVHRDVSPQNVFVTHHGQVKVVDFGVAKANIGSNITSPGVFKGKFAYAAPEQLLGRPVDGRCDVFAVGVMLWEAIAGRRFGVPKPTVDAFRVRTQGLEPKVSQVTPEVDPLLAEICDHALAVDPLQRVESADALRARLQEWLLLQGEHIQAKQLAAFMHERFKEERVHRRHIIERAMVDAGASQSTVAALPRELLERESGMSPRVDGDNGASERDSQHASSSGISPSPRAHAHQVPPPEHARPAQRRENEASQHASTAALQYPPEQAQAPAAKARRTFSDQKTASRLSSAAVLLSVAVGVFLVTFQLSRRAIEPPSFPRLRPGQDSALPAATNRGSEPVQPYLAEPPPSPPSVTGLAQPYQPAADPVLPSEPATRPQAPRASSVAAEPAVREREPREAATREREPATRERPRRDATLREHSLREPTPREPAPRELPSHAAPTAAAPLPAASSVMTNNISKLTVRDFNAATDGEAAAKAARTRPPPPLERVPAATSKPRPGASPARPDSNMGTDLRQMRNHGPSRIDTEDPYQ